MTAFPAEPGNGFGFDRVLLILWKDADAGNLRLLADYQMLLPEQANRIAEEYLVAVRSIEEDRRDRSGTGASRIPPTAERRRRIGPYLILAELGSGGQGTVYLAEDERLGRRVALKVLDRAPQNSACAIARFHREAKTASRLDHPGICTVYESGMDGEIPFIAMRYVEGDTLAARIRRARGENLANVHVEISAKHGARSDSTDTLRDDVLTPPRTPTTQPTRSQILAMARIVEDAARALHYAHERGVVHRDIKPGNIMVTDDDQAVVLDFGLARDDEALSQSLTGANEVFGTPPYLAPEQIEPEIGGVDIRTDVYALGVTLFEATTLRRPFEHPTRDGLYRLILDASIPDPRRTNPLIPLEIRTIITTAMEKVPARRYETALALAEDLRRARAHEPILARQPSLLTRALRWTQRNPAVALSLTAVILILAVSVAILVHANAQKDAAILASEAERLISESRQILNADPTLALLLAMEADRLRPSLRADTAMRRALADLRELRTIEGVSSCCGDVIADRLLVRLVNGDAGILKLPECVMECVLAKGVPAPLLGALINDGKLAVLRTTTDTAAVFDLPKASLQRKLESIPNIVEIRSIERRGAFTIVDRDGVTVFDAATLATRRRIDSNGSMALRTRASPDGAHLIVHYSGGRSIVSRLVGEADAEVPVLDEGAGDFLVRSGAFSHDGRRYLDLHPSNGGATLYTTADWSVVPGAPLPRGATEAVFAKDGSLALACGRKGIAILAPPFESSSPRWVETANPIADLCVEADGSLVHAADDHGGIHVIDTRDALIVDRFMGHAGPIFRLVSANRRGHLLSLGRDATLRLWRHRADLESEFPFPILNALCPAISPRDGSMARADDQGAITIGIEDLALALRAAARFGRSPRASPHHAESGGSFRAGFSSEGRMVVGLGIDEGGHLLDIDSGKSIPVRGTAGTARINSASVSAGGEAVAFRTDIVGLHALLPGSGGVSQPCSTGIENLGVYALHPRGEFMIAVDHGARRVLVVPVAGNDRHAGIGPFPAVPTALSLSEDGAWVAIAVPKQGIHVYRLSEPDRPVVDLVTEKQVFTRLVFDASRRLLAAVSEQGDATVFDLASSRRICGIPDDARVVQVAFDNDHGTIVTLSREGRVVAHPLDARSASATRVPRPLTSLERARYLTLSLD